MRKRKERIERSETLISNPKQIQTQSKEGGEQEEEVAEEGKGFFACYLLCSLCPRFKGQTYIGFTVNPCRRIRQHNGELRSGAWRTKSKRPWEMILCIYGFPTNVMALQFEWAWQHPTESLAVRKAAASLKSLSGIAGKIKIAYTMLTLPPWESLKLTVNFFSTKYMKEAVGCKSLPKQMKVQFCPMEELPCYTGCEQIFEDEDDQDEDAENGTNQRRSVPTYTSANNLAESPVTSLFRSTNLANTVPSVEDHRQQFHLVDSPVISPFRTTNLVNSVPTVEDHGQAFHLVDSPVISPFRSTNLVNSIPMVEDHRRPFHLVDSPVISPYRSTNLVKPVPTVQDRDPSTLIEKKLDEVCTSPGEDHSQPFHLVDSPVVSSFRSTNLVNPVKIVEDRDPFALIWGNQPEDAYVSRGEDYRQPFRPVDSPVMSTFRNNDPLGLIERRDDEFGGDTKQKVSSPVAVKRHQLSSFANDLLSPEFNSDSTSCAEKDSSPVKMSFSQNSGLAKIVGDKDDNGLLQESNDLEVISPQQCSETPPFTDNKQPLPTENHLAPHQVEVIDISTPSSIDRFRGFRKKKKRNNWISQGVIDLTKSPNFIEL